MQAHQRLRIDDPSQVGDARRRAQVLSNELRLDEVVAGRVALGVNELGNNLLRHAGGGELLLGPARGGVDLLSLDRGPGMDLARCLRDGYSTGGTAGTGLGAVKRLASEFSGFSLPGRGSVIATHFRDGEPPEAPTKTFRVAGLAVAAPGEYVCGDAWGHRRLPGGQLALLLADGLGHGPDAAKASDAAVAGLQHASASLLTSPSAALRQVHEALRSTRGAAASLVLVDASAGRLLYSGAGNVVGRLVSGVSDRTLLSQHGTLGLQVRTLQDIAYDWPAHAMLVQHSDGIATRWNLSDVPGLLQCEPAVVAAWILRDHCRGRDDATVVVVQLG